MHRHLHGHRLTDSRESRLGELILRGLAIFVDVLAWDALLALVFDETFFFLLHIGVDTISTQTHDLVAAAKCKHVTQVSLGRGGDIANY